MVGKGMLKKNTGMMFLIYIYTFFVFYMPRITDLLYGINVEYFSVLLLLFMSIPWIIICKTKTNLVNVNKSVFLLIVGIIISAIYFMLRAMLVSEDIRLFQNLYIIVQIIHVLFIFDFMKKSGLVKEEMLKVLFNLVLIQAVISIFMLVFPSLKDIALSLYYLNREENIFISRMRIYGISSDYTFFTPIYHGILAGIVFIYAIFKNKRYLIYLPFMLLVILLNGRFGLLIFAIAPIIVAAYFIVRGKLSFKMISISTLTLIIFILGISSLSVVSPHTYKWIIGGAEDTLNLIKDNEKTGNYVALVDQHLSFPKGKDIIFGEGFRLYGAQAQEKGYNSSDIGYVNDMFMGGLIYITILYGSILFFILRKSINREGNNLDINLETIISTYLILVLLISNYKGESMRSGIILLGVIFISLIIKNGNVYNHKTYDLTESKVLIKR